MPGNYQRLQIGVNSFTVDHAYALTFVVVSATAAVCQKVTDNVGQCMAKEPKERNILTECVLHPDAKDHRNYNMVICPELRLRDSSAT